MHSKSNSKKAGYDLSTLEGVAMLKVSMEDCDSLVLRSTSEVVGLAKGALSILALDPDALVHVRELLLLIVDRAQSLRDAVNYEAEQSVGVSNGDSKAREFHERVCADFHKLKAS